MNAYFLLRNVYFLIQIPDQRPAHLYSCYKPQTNFSASALDEGQAHPRNPSVMSGGKRLSLTTRTQFILIRKQTRRRHAALAGGIAGGLAIMWEKRGRRTFIGQQTRNDFSSFTTNIRSSGLQGSWNAFATKRNIHVPHGEVIIFALAYVRFIFQNPDDSTKKISLDLILYAYLLRRDNVT